MLRRYPTPGRTSRRGLDQLGPSASQVRQGNINHMGPRSIPTREMMRFQSAKRLGRLYPRSQLPADHPVMLLIAQRAQLRSQIAIHSGKRHAGRGKRRRKLEVTVPKLKFMEGEDK